MKDKNTREKKARLSLSKQEMIIILDVMRVDDPLANDDSHIRIRLKIADCLKRHFDTI